jgi:TetR/AcrR family transcriptional regulator, transcriptional repressor for nem operon
MTMARTSNKYDRLTAAANNLFLQKGFNMTTLADIANDANVPLGNVYYYFKTKSHIAMAVIELQHKQIIQGLESFSEEIDPKARLSKLVQHCLSHDVDDNEKLSVLMVGLWNDLSVESGDVFVKLQEATQTLITWCAGQFEKIGKGEESHQYARHLFAYLQGLLLHRKSNPISSQELPTESLMIARSLGFA